MFSLRKIDTFSHSKHYFMIKIDWPTKDRNWLKNENSAGFFRLWSIHGLSRKNLFACCKYMVYDLQNRFETSKSTEKWIFELPGPIKTFEIIYRKLHRNVKIWANPLPFFLSKKVADDPPEWTQYFGRVSGQCRSTQKLNI